jgi:hypothetical protein
MFLINTINKLLVEREGLNNCGNNTIEQHVAVSCIFIITNNHNKQKVHIPYNTAKKTIVTF